MPLSSSNSPSRITSLRSRPRIVRSSVTTLTASLYVPGSMRIRSPGSAASTAAWIVSNSAGTSSTPSPRASSASLPASVVSGASVSAGTSASVSTGASVATGASVSTAASVPGPPESSSLPPHAASTSTAASPSASRFIRFPLCRRPERTWSCDDGCRKGSAIGRQHHDRTDHAHLGRGMDRAVVRVLARRVEEIGVLVAGSEGFGGCTPRRRLVGRDHVVIVASAVLPTDRGAGDDLDRLGSEGVVERHDVNPVAVRRDGSRRRRRCRVAGLRGVIVACVVLVGHVLDARLLRGACLLGGADNGDGGLFRTVVTTGGHENSDGGRRCDEPHRVREGRKCRHRDTSVATPSVMRQILTEPTTGVIERPQASVVSEYSSRSVFFENLPTLVLGTSSIQTIFLGSCHLAILPSRNVSTSSSVRSSPGAFTTQASGASPQRSWATPHTAASALLGWAISSFSSSTELIHSPPDLMRSLVRSTSRIRPRSSTVATSPVRSQPSAVKLSCDRGSL